MPKAMRQVNSSFRNRRQVGNRPDGIENARVTLCPPRPLADARGTGAFRHDYYPNRRTSGRQPPEYEHVA